MNKKDARQKKQEADKKLKRDILDSPIIGGDGEEAIGEEAETLLGNLAPVKQIPMLPWFEIPVLPLFERAIHLPNEAEKDEWMKKLFKETAESECDLIGFMPVPDLGEAEFDDVAPGSIGIAAQILKIEETALKSTIVHLKGICRFENLGFLPAPEEYFTVKVRWLEDDEESDAVLRPVYEEYLKTVERVAKTMGERMKHFYSVSTTTEYHPRTAQYSSFMMLMEKFSNWFTPAEKLELLRLTSTAERLRRVTARAEIVIPLLQKRVGALKKGENN